MGAHCTRGRDMVGGAGSAHRLQLGQVAMASTGRALPRGRRELSSSYAAPAVAGVAALLLEQGLSNVEVVQRLKDTAEPAYAASFPLPDPNPLYGHGLVNAYCAVTAGAGARCASAGRAVADALHETLFVSSGSIHANVTLVASGPVTTVLVARPAVADGRMPG